MSQTLEELLHTVAENLGRGPQDVETFIELLRQHWYDDPESLKTLSQEDIQAIGIPMRISKELANMGALANPVGTAAASSSAPALANRPQQTEKNKGDKGDKGDKGEKGDKGDKGGKGKGGKDRDRDKGKGKSKGKGKQRTDQSEKDKPKDGEDTSRMRTVPVPTEGCHPDFPWKERLVGINARNMRHIRESTSVRICVQGDGGSDLCLQLTPSEDSSESDISKAVEMCEDLGNTVAKEAASWEIEEGDEDGHDRPRQGNRKGKRQDKGKGKGKSKGKGKGKGKGEGKDKGSSKGKRGRDSTDDGPAEKRRR